MSFGTKGNSPLLKQERLRSAYCVRAGTNNLLVSARRAGLYSGNRYGGRNQQTAGEPRGRNCTGAAAAAAAAAHPSVHWASLL